MGEFGVYDLVLSPDDTCTKQVALDPVNANLAILYSFLIFLGVGLLYRVFEHLLTSKSGAQKLLSFKKLLKRKGFPVSVCNVYNKLKRIEVTHKRLSLKIEIYIYIPNKMNADLDSGSRADVCKKRNSRRTSYFEAKTASQVFGHFSRLEHGNLNLRE
jgi:hypothetical protein